MLFNLQLKRETKVDVFTAVEMLAISWRVTRREVINNCFRKAGAQKPCPSLHGELASDDEASDKESAESTAEVAESWKELVDHSGVGNDVNLDDFISSDACAVTTEELNDDTIIESVSKKRVRDDSTDSEQEPEEVSVKPTATEVMDAIEVLRRHAGEHSLEQALLALSAYKRDVMPTLVKKRQTLLTDFFATA